MQYAFEMTPLGLVVQLRGPVRGGVAVSSWHDALRRCCARGRRRIVVDCTDIDTVDAAGLGALIGALAIMRNAGGDLAIACVPDALRSLLLITRLTDVLPPHPIVESACRSIALPSQSPGPRPRLGRYP
jgi:anti-sigma B factor antagonist